jgi:chromosome segregation protein
VHVVGLKIAGFKSFVDPVDVPVEPGLTGVVGPNGCGKSNLLEALRWAMGASSAKAMRGGEMDDLIFAGTAERPAREIAEVALLLDNASRKAPAEFNDLDMIEIRRSLRRGAGSTYRINDRLVRARDVQILFADASTGANSPALVRQGQISELIASKPQNRRRILEEAAGIGGLAARRHEAELKLEAAEANLARLAEIMAEIERQAGALKRQAGKARRYRALSDAIAAFEARVAAARWRGAVQETQAAKLAIESARLAEAEAVSQNALASALELERRAAIDPLRAAEAEASGKLGVVKLALARLEAERGSARDLLAQLERDEQRIAIEVERERATLSEAEQRAQRAASELGALPPEDPALVAKEEADLAATLEQTRRDLGRADAEAEALKADLARADALAFASADALKRERDRLARIEEELARTPSALADLGDASRLAAAVATARDRADKLKHTAEAAQSELSEAVRGLEAARAEEARLIPALRAAEQRAGELDAELKGLERLLVRASGPARPPVMDEIRANGLERALAAALDSDLDAPVDASAPVHWSDRASQSLLQLPDGATPLVGLVEAPTALAARLAQCGLVDQAAGDRLQSDLTPGQRLVSREGDLWRWDGFVRRADAPSPTVEKLAQRARRTRGLKELANARRELEAAVAAKDAASAALTGAELQVMERRRRVPAAMAAASDAREALLRAEQASEMHSLRAGALRDTRARLDAERAQASIAVTAARTALAQRPGDQDRARLTALATRVTDLREAERTAAAALETHRRETGQARNRRSALVLDRDEWSARAGAARVRLEEAEAALARTREVLQEASVRPGEIDARLSDAAETAKSAEASRKAAADALARADTELREAEFAMRSARDASASAREALVRGEARLEAAERREAEIAAANSSAFGKTLEALERLVESQQVVDETVEGADAGRLDDRLSALRREREALGAVNMEADQQLEEIAGRMDLQSAERDDLAAAIAKLREGVDALNQEGRARLLEAFEAVSGHFRSLFVALFGGGEAELRLTESADPLDAGLEIYASPPGKRLAALSLMSGGEQALTAAALIFAVFLSRPAPICVLDEVDAPLDDANVDRFCRLLDEMRRRTDTRFIVITHNAVTMSRMDRLYGVTMQERGVSRLVSVDLEAAERLAAA